jgi:elongation factor G
VYACGSAYKNKGVQLLLDNVCRYLPSPAERKKNEASTRTTGEKVCSSSRPQRRRSLCWPSSSSTDRYGQLTYVRVYQGTLRKGDTIINNNTGQEVEGRPHVRDALDEMRRSRPSGRLDICALFGVECASGDTFTDGNSIRYTMTSMHVPDAGHHARCQAQEEARARPTSPRRSTASRRKTPPSAPPRRRSPARPSSPAWASSTSRSTSSVSVASTACEVEAGKPQVAYRETINSAFRLRLHAPQADRWIRPVRPSVAGYIEPLDDAGETYEFVNEIVGGVIPREFTPSCDKGFQEADQEGLASSASRRQRALRRSTTVESTPSTRPTTPSSTAARAWASATPTPGQARASSSPS